MNKMLEIKNISKTFNPGTVNEKTALNGLSLTLNDGDFVTVIGGNGAGKSTLLNAVAGTWRVDSGNILIDGVDVTKMPEFKRAKFLGRVFQDPMMGTVPTMGIDENLALAARTYAFIKRRGYVIPEDVRAIAHDVMRHRIGLTYEAEAANVTADEIISKILNKVEVP